MKIGGLLSVLIRAGIFCQRVYREGNMLLNTSVTRILPDLWLLGGIFEVVAKGVYVSA